MVERIDDEAVFATPASPAGACRDGASTGKSTKPGFALAFGVIASFILLA